MAKKLVDGDYDIRGESAELRNFLVATFAITQGLSQYMRLSGLGSEWKVYEGKYSKTKVDFDEDCDLLNTFGSHLFSKSIITGQEYSAVFIGPTENNFGQAFRGLLSSQEHSEYVMSTLRYMADSYGLLLEGKLENKHLLKAAELAGLHDSSNEKNILVTKELYEKYAFELNEIRTSTCEYYSSQMERILKVLSKTTSGKQGVCAESMLMHFWRYFSRVLGTKLYEFGFLTDDIPKQGSITVFFKNEIVEIRDAFL